MLQLVGVSVICAAIILYLKSVKPLLVVKILDASSPILTVPTVGVSVGVGVVVVCSIPGVFITAG